MVLKPWVLVASLLLQAHYQYQGGVAPQAVALEELTEHTVWLRGLSREFGAFLHWPDNMLPSDVVSSSLSLHQGLVRVSEGRVWLALVEQGPAGAGDPCGDAAPEEKLFAQAVTVLSCASYRNQVLHVFLRPALLAAAIHTTPSAKKEDVFNSFCFLRNMMANEFILCPGADVQDFDEACYLLGKMGALQVSQLQVAATCGGYKTLNFLTAMLDPFLQGYQVVCRYLCEEAPEGLTEKQFVPAVRNFSVKLLLAGHLKHCEVLSSDLQKNALAALLRLGAVQRVKGTEQVTLKVNKMRVNSLEDTLGGKLSTQKSVLSRL